MKYTIELTKAENKALSYISKNPQEWIQNAAINRARIAMDEIVQLEVSRMTADPNIEQIPANREEIVLSADLSQYRSENVFNNEV